MIFWLIILLILTINIFDKDIYRKNKWYFILSLLLISLVAIRSVYVGSDTATYATLYQKAGDIDFSHLQNQYPSMEKGFLILCMILSHLKLPFQLFQILIALISIGGVYCYIEKFSKDKSLSLFLYFTTGAYFITMSAMRQCLAIGIIMFAIIQLRKNHIMKFSILILIASLFHISALLIFVFIPLQAHKYSIKFLIAGIGISILFIFMIDKFIAVLPSKYAYYVTTDMNIGMGNMIQISFFIGQLLLAYFVIKNTDTKKNRISQYNLIMYSFTFQCLFELMTLRVDIISRVTMLFTPLNILLWPIVIDGIQDKMMKQGSKIFICGMYIVYFIVWLYLNSGMNYYPYSIL